LQTDKRDPCGLTVQVHSFAPYPFPPQFGQRPQATPLPLGIEGIVHEASAKFAAGSFALRITNKNAGFAGGRGNAPPLKATTSGAD
jgi:hypothetical protein